MNILGLDYGRRSIGVAIACGPLSEPFGKISTSSSLQTLQQIVTQNKIDLVIVGVPEGPIKEETQKFVEKISNLPSFKKIKVQTADETLSSQDAIKSLLHTSKTRRRRLEHSVAAAIILQSWLDSNIPTV